MSSLEDYKRALDTQTRARKIAEAQLEEKSRELYVKNTSLREALRKLQQQQQQLIVQEKQASIGQLSAGLAHEINNPNAFVQSNLESLENYTESITQAITMMLSDIDKTDCARVKSLKDQFDLDYILDDAGALIRESIQGTQRIQRIVSSLRYFTNPDTKNRKQFDVDACVRHTVELLGLEADLDIEVDESYGKVGDYKGMPTLLSLALGNLLKNAAQSNPKSEKISINTSRNEKELCISISDDGEGIPSDSVQRIFDPFFTTKEAHNGLGLTTSWAIVHQHDGMIDIDSKMGVGTKVCIRLPLPTA